MAKYLIQNKTLQGIAGAIREKAGITDDMTPREMMEQICLLETDTDVGAPAHGVFFYDYDGTLLYSYTVKEARALTALPDPPTHDGLPFAGWTHTLEEVKSTLKYLDVGAMYDPPSTKIVMEIDSANTAVPMNLFSRTTDGASVTINWGDGTTQSLSVTTTTSIEHTYTSSGTYTIEFQVLSGVLDLGNSFGYSGKPLFKASNGGYPVSHMIQSAIIANNTVMTYGTFINAKNLKSVVIGLGTSTVGGGSFIRTQQLKCVIFPLGINQISNSMFWQSSSVTTVILPSSINALGYSLFQEATALERIIIPSSVKRWNIDVFLDATALSEVHIRCISPPSVVGSLAFPSNFLIYVPIESVDIYKTADGWSTYASQIYGEPI